MAELTLASLSCLEFIVASLSSDPTVEATVGGRIYDSVAPLIDGATGQAPAYPYVTVAYLSLAPTYSAGVLIGADVLFLVLLVGATLAQRKAALPVLLATLTGTDGTVNGVHVGAGVNEGDYADSPPLPGGEIVRRTGARLRFFCSNVS